MLPCQETPPDCWGRRVCQCECDELHVRQLGPIGVLLAKIADVGLDVFQERNGDLPLPAEYTNLVKILAAGSASARPLARILPLGERMTSVPEAAGMLNVTPAHARRLAASGRFAGATKRGRDWLIPAASVQDYRRHRDAA